MKKRVCPITHLKLSNIMGRPAVFVPEHPKSNNRGYVLRARYLMEQKLGRSLGSREHVHHKDENPTNDHLGNLEVMSIAEHSRHHSTGRSSSLPGRGTKAARKIKGKRGLNYKKIQTLMSQGLGYRRIAKILDEKLYSVKYACKVLS